MKKLVLVAAVLFLALTACKKKEDPALLKAAPEQGEVDCSKNETMKELNDLKNVPEVLDWLKEHGERICSENLYLCIEERHVIEQEDFDNYVSDHPDNHPVEKSYTMTWGDISTFIKENDMACYSKFVGFTFNKDEVSLKSVNFTASESCYSVPLLRGIADRHNLGNSDSLTFVKAMLPDPSKPTDKIEKVLIKYVGSASTSYYDLSDDPR
jgi:hypothetical protein